MLTSPDIRAAVTSKSLRDSGRVSLSFSPPLSARRKEAPLASGREAGGGGEILT